MLFKSGTPLCYAGVQLFLGVVPQIFSLEAGGGVGWDPTFGGRRPPQMLFARKYCFAKETNDFEFFNCYMKGNTFSETINGTIVSFALKIVLFIS